MPAPTSIAPRTPWISALNKDLGAGVRNSISSVGANTPTTGLSFVYITAPEDGYIHSVEFASDIGLAANDTNYISFSIRNFGRDGLGNINPIASIDANTTKLTGGSSLNSAARRIMILSNNLADLKINAGDRIRCVITITGSIASLTYPTWLIRFNP